MSDFMETFLSPQNLLPAPNLWELLIKNVSFGRILGHTLKHTIEFYEGKVTCPVS